MNPLTTLRFPWRKGLHDNENKPVWVTASRLSFDSFLTLTQAAPGAISLWAGWGNMEGAVGLSMRVQPTRLASWTISVWEDENASKNFIKSENHQKIMAQYSKKGVSGSDYSWEEDEFDLASSWERAILELDPKYVE